MKRAALIIVFCLSVTASRSQAAPTNTLPDAYRPVVAIPAEIDLPTPVADPSGPMTPGRLATLIVSGPLYYSFAAGMSHAPTPTATSSDTPALTAHRSHRIAANTITPLSNVNTTNDTLQDVEPTIAAVNIGGTMHTTTVSTKFDTAALNSTYHIYAYHTTDLTNYTRLTLASPINRFTRTAAYNSIADPLMSVNPYPNGVWPGRMYVTALGENLPNPSSANSGIHVWSSDNGGAAWSNAATVQTQAGGGFVMDKPSIAVSWQQHLRAGQTFSSLGYVYVAYTVVNAAGTNNQIRVGVSTDGGASFTLQSITGATGLVNFPQIVVDDYGTATVIWFQQQSGTNSLRMAQSLDYGATYSSSSIITTTDVIVNQQIQGMAPARASSVPMARYNSNAGRIALVYYGRASGGLSQVYYTYNNCSQGVCGSWSTPNQVNTALPHGEAFNAAIAVNKTNGNLAVSWFNIVPQSVGTTGVCNAFNPDGTCLGCSAEFVE